jgi:uncharacterized sulfatase
MTRWLARIGVVLLLLVGLGWWFQDRILLEVVGLLARQDVGPPRVIEWDTGPATAPPASERPPNIVLILADDLGWNDLTFAGGGVAGGTVPTPRIDSLAREGVNFSWGYAGNGTCAPSRAAIMSGRYPTRFGFEFTPTPPGMAPMMARLANRADRIRPAVTHFDEHGEGLPYDEMGMPASEITLAELLKGGGYHTVHIGKWHLGRANGMAPHEQGFDESLLMASGLYLPEDDPGVVNSKQDFDPIDRFLWKAMQFAASFNGSEPFEPAGYLTDYYTEQAVKVIEANRNRPFLLYLAHWTPHTPLQAARADYEALSHIEDHTLRVYAAMIRSLERSVGAVLDALEANGLAENTLVVFTSDNGGANYIGLPEVNQPYRGWKISFFEGGIHVPFFMRWPKGLPRGTTLHEPVHHFDVFATAAAAAGIPLPADREMDGVDLAPFARGEDVGSPHDALFWRTGHYQVALSEGWKLQRNQRPDGDRTWLFDLNTDATEQHDVAAQHPERVAQLEAKLAAHNARQIEPAWPSLLEAPISIDKTLRDPQAEGDEHIYWPN